MDRLIDILRSRRPDDPPYLVGITGAVAVGKSTLTAALAAEPERFGGDGATAAVLATDCFLRPNAL